MIGVQNQKDIEGLNQVLVDDVGPHRGVEHHVKKIGTVCQVLPGVNDLVTLGDLEGHGGHGPHLRDEPGEGDIYLLFFRPLWQLGIKCTHGIHHGRQNPHGMSPPWEVLEEVCHIFVHK